MTGSGVDVPCGDCNACCRSSYFIHIRPDETQTIANINRKLLFAAPGLPKGNLVMGYDQHGHCPMLIADKCSVYAHRPHTCRAYDCRIFTATGISAGDDDNKIQVNQRIQRWQFSYPEKRDLDEYAAVQAAALFLREHADCFPTGVVPSNATQLAVMAIKVYEVFLTDNDDLSETGRVTPDLEVAQAIIEVNEQFDTRCDVVKVSTT